MKYILALFLLTSCTYTESFKYNVGDCGGFKNGTTFKVLDETNEAYRIVCIAPEGRIMERNNQKTCIIWEQKQTIDGDSFKIKCEK